MKNCTVHSFIIFEILLILCFTSKGIIAKSVKLRTKTTSNTGLTSGIIQYPKAKVRKPLLSQSNVLPETKLDTISKQSTTENSEDIIQTTFNLGLRRIVNFFRRFMSNSGDEHSNETGGTNFRIPGLPTSPIFPQLDVSSIVKLLEATDGSQVEILAENAAIDLISQLVKIIGFNDLREWLGIVLMYFVLGPILIPLFWLPISLFGMAGLLAPLFFFNPPSKPNVDVMGHDPILPEVGEKRSVENFILNLLKTSSFPTTIFAQTSKSTAEILESCVERVSCHLTRMYRDNPLSKWLTSHFNTTKVEWARVHPKDDINENGISSWEDCKKYACTMFPAA